MNMNRMDILLWLAVQEDLGHADVTTEAVVDDGKTGAAVVIGRQSFVLSGTWPFRRVFELLDPRVRVEELARDGDFVRADIPVFRLEGPVRSLLTGERTALNFVQRLSGIATFTRRMVEQLKGTTCRLLDTRKTTPLWRSFEKAAVRHGGAFNHRFGLYDGVLIKDNHLAAVGGIAEAVRAARERAPHTLKIEVEVEDLDGLREAVAAGADVVLLDNFSLDMLREAVKINRGHTLLEASGGVNIETVQAIARTGVDFISCGALTHSAGAIDLSMEFEV
ncbi:MAG: carboxylating nicotinate-nucleotide diphosphorylase [Syntrophobacteraceae bacterium]|nr:carboxylating nicotinate-nucleotide diphosphorylase [Syntrophobacteraceae bacterium]